MGGNFSEDPFNNEISEDPNSRTSKGEKKHQWVHLEVSKDLHTLSQAKDVEVKSTLSEDKRNNVDPVRVQPRQAPTARVTAKKSQPKIYSLNIKAAKSYRQKRLPGNTEEDFEILGTEYFSPPMDLLNSIEDVEEPQTKTSLFVNLSSNILQNIVSFISTKKTFLSCILTCKSFRDFIYDEDTKNFVIFPIYKTLPFVEVPYVKHIEVLNFSLDIDVVRLYFPNLRSMICSYGFLKRKKFPELFQLQELMVKNTFSENLSIDLPYILKSQQKLESLVIKGYKLENSKILGDSICSNLRKLVFHKSDVSSSDNDIICSVFPVTPNLEFLGFINCGLEDEFFEKLFFDVACDLQTLCFAKNKITSKGMHYIVESFPFCDSFDFQKNRISVSQYLEHYGKNIVDSVMNIKKLDISMNVVDLDAEKVIQFLSYFKNLKFVNLTMKETKIFDGVLKITEFGKERGIKILI